MDIAHIVKAYAVNYTVMASSVMAHIVIGNIVMACTVIAYIVMACLWPAYIYGRALRRQRAALPMDIGHVRQ